MKKITIPVDVKAQTYDIFIGNDFFDFIITEIIQLKLGNKYAVITDSTVNPLHAGRFMTIARNKGLDITLFEFPAGEKNKNRTTKNRLDDCLLENGFGRDGVVIAVGGGVVGDMAGFVAATYMRGIPYVQIPTTIISQADSSIGGKTAIDVPQGKNLLGAFHHPHSVFIDINTLDTLDTRNYTSGMIEIIKHSIIKDRELFDYIDNKAETILDRKCGQYTATMMELLINNCRIKNEVVAKDTKESNLRKILNYGHTIGHAVEHLSGYQLLHGESIAIGVAVEAYFSWKSGYSGEEDYTGQVKLLEKMRLPTKIPVDMTIDNIIEVMRHDKKARKSIPEFVLIEKIGQYKVFEKGKTTTKIPESDIRKMLAELMEK